MMRVSPPDEAREFPGPPGVEQGDAGSALDELEGSPATERTCPNHCDMRLHFHKG